MNRCLICFNKVEESLLNNKVCNRCLSSFKVVKKTIKVDEKEVFILYEYNDFFRKLLYRFKGCFDKELRDAFLENYKLYIKSKYRNRIAILTPSFRGDDLKRGFNHIEEIAKSIGIKYDKFLIKNRNIKQANQRYKDRGKIKGAIDLIKNVDIGKKYVLIDDVTTSLSTLKTIIKLLPENLDLKVFILASNFNFMKGRNKHERQS